MPFSPPSPSLLPLSRTTTSFTFSSSSSHSTPSKFAIHASSLSLSSVLPWDSSHSKLHRAKWGGIKGENNTLGRGGGVCGQLLSPLRAVHCK